MTGEQTPGTNLRKLRINVFLPSVGHHVPLKITTGFAKVFCGGRFLLAKMFVSTSKNLEAPFIYYRVKNIYIYVYIFLFHRICMIGVLTGP